MNDLVKNYNEGAAARQLTQAQDPKAMRDALVETASKNAVPLTSEQKLKTLMSAEAYQLLQSIMAWAIVWEKVKNGEALTYDESTQNVMLAPLTFFGQSMPLFSALSGQIIPTMLYHIEQYRSDPIYAKANPMPWLVLQIVAPMLAQLGFGASGMREAMSIIAEMKKEKELPT